MFIETEFLAIFVGADVIFLIYLYQRRAYPVDKKRVNEFGFGGEDEDEAAAALTSGTSAEDKKTN